MFDSIYLKIKCPYCNEVSKMECQTKEGRCCLDHYKVGDTFDNGQFRIIDAYATCESFTCRLESAKESVWTMGYYGGFSRSFDIKVYCDSKGKITNKIKIFKLNSHKGIMEGKLGELKEKDDNMKVVKYAGFNKKGKWVEAKLKPMTTDGWLDKFRDDKTRWSYQEGKPLYEAIMYLFNLEDSKEAFTVWFVFRHKLAAIIQVLKEKLNLKENEEFASFFLSNNIEDIMDLIKEKGGKNA